MKDTPSADRTDAGRDRRGIYTSNSSVGCFFNYEPSVIAFYQSVSSFAPKLRIDVTAFWVLMKLHDVFATILITISSTNDTYVD